MSSLKAHLRFKTDCDSKQADEHIIKYCQQYNIHLKRPEESVSVILLPYDDIDKNVNFTINRILKNEPNTDKNFISNYRKYQKLFNEELDKYVKSNSFTNVIDCTKPIPDVQTEIKQALVRALQKQQLSKLAKQLQESIHSK
jgi:hypothetical protein